MNEGAAGRKPEPGNGLPPWAATTIVMDDTTRRAPAIIEITDGVYCAYGYAFANVFFVTTATSLVVIDSTESLPAARAALSDFRQISQLPISFVIYTHHHGDHTRAAKVFRTQGTKIIAQKLLPQEIARKDLFLPYRMRVNAHQFATATGVAAAPAVRSAMTPEQADPGYVPPDITFDDEYCFEDGGVTFELRHTQGETFDHLMIWLPQKRVLFPADLFYAYFPMLSSPMKPNRPIAAWADSLERMGALQPEYLAPSHGPPMRGAEEIRQTLLNYARAIRHVHDETVNCINAGRSLEESLREVKLPADLARLSYLQQKYGKVSWAVRGIFRQYTGWYSFNPTDLNPSPEPLLHRVLLEVCGGAAALIHQARSALQAGDFQLVLELTDIVMSAHADHPRAARLRIVALNNLAARTENRVERNVYRNAAKFLNASFPDPLD